MKEFMMIFRNEMKTGTDAPSAEQMQAVLKQWQQWILQIVENGKFVSVNRLLPEGKTLKPDSEVKDGPYAEAKEIVGGYVIAKASTLEEAVEMAKSCPVLKNGGKVEVRTVMPIEYNVKSADFLSPEKNSVVSQ
jgi:hypothetical protein